MSKRAKIIYVAESKIGAHENPPGSNSVWCNDWFYGTPVKNGVPKKSSKYPWCATFVSWVYFTAGCRLPVMDYSRGFASCIFAHKFFKKRNEFTNDPQPGDIVLFEFNGDTNDDHVGIFHSWKVKGVSFYCIEGNTSPDDKGSQDNGGCVAKKLRNVKLVSAFVSPEILKK